MGEHELPKQTDWSDSSEICLRQMCQCQGKSGEITWRPGRVNSHDTDKQTKMPVCRRSFKYASGEMQPGFSPVRLMNDLISE